MCCWARPCLAAQVGAALKGRHCGSNSRRSASCQDPKSTAQCFGVFKERAACGEGFPVRTPAGRVQSGQPCPAGTLVSCCGQPPTPSLPWPTADSQRGPRLLSGCTRGVQSGAPALLVPRNHAGIIQLAGCAASWSAGAPGVAVLRSSGWSALQIDSSCIAGDSSGGTKRGRGTSRWAAWHEEAKVCVCVCVSHHSQHGQGQATLHLGSLRGNRGAIRGLATGLSIPQGGRSLFVASLRGGKRAACCLAITLWPLRRRGRPLLPLPQPLPTPHPSSPAQGSGRRSQFPVGNRPLQGRGEQVARHNCF